MTDMTLNHIRVTRRERTIFVPLPRELWTRAEMGGISGCICGKCYGTGYWDTLAIARNGNGEWSDRTWTVHYPELQPASVRLALKAEVETASQQRELFAKETL